MSGNLTSEVTMEETAEDSFGTHTHSGKVGFGQIVIAKRKYREGENREKIRERIRESKEYRLFRVIEWYKYSISYYRHISNYHLIGLINSLVE